ncbi:hypothetical protein JCM19314_1078 [Nonlabens ulvanivorans]|uniref:Uncharacterized protein n=1 Tax=Nonlabens ulvanivorans TaxID=906888 RepID=A0A090QDN8_NONUL|nr:hypothetical protein JCM19314_1078 [Nonlabens ulvanivorans]
MIPSLLGEKPSGKTISQRSKMIVNWDVLKHPVVLFSNLANNRSVVTPDWNGTV